MCRSASRILGWYLIGLDFTADYLRHFVEDTSSKTEFLVNETRLDNALYPKYQTLLQKIYAQVP